jgi:hypothetical protein
LGHVRMYTTSQERLNLYNKAKGNPPDWSSIAVGIVETILQERGTVRTMEGLRVNCPS